VARVGQHLLGVLRPVGSSGLAHTPSVARR
jgi:hypothetical protein